jgi:hypothetical protein
MIGWITIAGELPHWIIRNSRSRTEPEHHAMGNPGATLACAPRGSAGHPHFLEIVKISHFRSKDVDDHVPGVDQHPITMRHAFDLGANADLVQILDHSVGD